MLTHMFKAIFGSVGFGKGFNLELEENPQVYSSRNDEIIKNLEDKVRKNDIKYDMKETRKCHSNMAFETNAVSQHASKVILNRFYSNSITLEKFIEDIDLPTLVFNSDGTIIKVSEELLEEFKLVESDIVGYTILDFIDIEAYSAITSYISKEVKDGTNIECEFLCNINQQPIPKTFKPYSIKLKDKMHVILIFG